MLQRIRNSQDIVSLVESYGIQLKKSGDRYRGLCPFHADRRPSLTIYPETDSFFCFGCNKGGNGYEFVKLIENCSFKEARRKLDPEGKATAIFPGRSVSTLRSELKAMEDVLEKILIRGLKNLNTRLEKGEISLCSYYTQRAIREDRLNRFDALRIQNHYYLRRNFR